jgi:Ca2+-binding EF-hand superfamily protein
VLFALGAIAADHKPPVGTISPRPTIALDSQAMQAMLRADRDKDGVLSRDEVDHYDMSLGRRFKEADTDRDGKLTFYEFEKLLAPRETSAGRR